MLKSTLPRLILILILLIPSILFVLPILPVQAQTNPTIGEFQAPSTVYANKFFFLNATINDVDDRLTLFNATITLSNNIVLGWYPSELKDTFTVDTSASYTDLAGTMTFQTEGSANDSFTGDGTTKTFQLTYYPIVPDSQTVKVDGVTQTEDTDYTINDGTGKLAFTTSPASGAVIEVTYTKRGCMYARDATLTVIEAKLNALKFGSGTYKIDMAINEPTTTVGRWAWLKFGRSNSNY